MTFSILFLLMFDWNACISLLWWLLVKETSFWVCTIGQQLMFLFSLAFEEILQLLFWIIRNYQLIEIVIQLIEIISACPLKPSQSVFILNKGNFQCLYVTDFFFSLNYSPKILFYSFRMCFSTVLLPIELIVALVHEQFLRMYLSWKRPSWVAWGN